MSLIDFNINTLLFALLMSFRVGAFFLTMPSFAEVRLPMVIAVILPIGISFLVAPVMAPDVMPVMTLGGGTLFLVILGEILVGVFMGFAVNLVMTLSVFVGSLVGMQAGLSLASMFDPNMGQVPMLGYYIRNFFLLMFFVMNVHHVLLWMLTQSYQSLPVGSDLLSFREGVPAVVKLFSDVFLMSFRFSLPVLVIILLSHVTMGIISLTAPQMNIYFAVALALNVVVAQAVFALSLPILFRFFESAMGMAEELIKSFILHAA